MPLQRREETKSYLKHSEQKVVQPGATHARVPTDDSLPRATTTSLQSKRASGTGLRT